MGPAGAGSESGEPRQRNDDRAIGADAQREAAVAMLEIDATPRDFEFPWQPPIPNEERGIRLKCEPNVTRAVILRVGGWRVTDPPEGEGRREERRERRRPQRRTAERRKPKRRRAQTTPARTTPARTARTARAQTARTRPSFRAEPHSGGGEESQSSR